MKSHLNKHFNDIRDLRLEYNTVKDKVEGEIGPMFTDIMLKSISKSLQRERLESFRTKNKKFFDLTKRKTKENVDYKVPIINLSNYQLNEKEYNQLKMGLNHCFINKDKNLKNHIAANMESIAYITSDKVDKTDLENFHEFLRGYTDIFAKNVISTEHHTYKELKTLIHNKDAVILKGDKDSSIVIMNKADYIKKWKQ